MADTYYDFNLDLHRIYEAFDEHGPSENTIKEPTSPSKRRRPIYPPPNYEVRKGVCVVGRHRDTVQQIKRQVAGLLEDPFPIESFHVKQPSDVQDGAFLVPKIIMVAPHTPGRKLIDEVSDEGMLDWLYDEAVQTGADLMIIYARLPKSIYPSMRHVIYHPKLSENLFPDQPILQELATENCFLTITENNELNKMQRNLLREWLMNPVAETHPVFQAADFLTSMELSSCDTSDSLRNVTLSIVNETNNKSQRYADNEGFTAEEVFVPATEEHPLADGRKEKRKKKKRRMKFSFKKPPRHAARDYVEATQVDFDNSSVELDLYNNSGMNPETASTFF